jgi:hypothetical protein
MENKRRTFIQVTLALAMLFLMPINTQGATAPSIAPAPVDYQAVNWARAPLRTLYASPSGGGDGLSRNAPKAFNRLVPSVRPGDRVVLLPGNYPNAEISLAGTAIRPITIEAEYPIVSPRHQLESSNRSVFKNSGLKITSASYLRVRGLAFAVDEAAYSSGIEVLRGDHLAFVRNYFLQNSNFGLLFFGVAEQDVTQVLVETNVFRNMLRAAETGGIGVRMDYGLRIHGTTTVVARNNLFDGYFNHAISLKERVRDALIEKNIFQTCGNICIEGGQEPDTFAGGTFKDRTVANVLVYANRFVGKDDGSTGIFARNVERLFVDGNSFVGLAYPLRSSNLYQNSRSCERQLARTGRMLAVCEHDSMLALTGRTNSGIVFSRNHVIGSAKIVVGGRGYPDDFLSVQDSTTTGKVVVSRRQFVFAADPWNRWTSGVPQTVAPPPVFVGRSPGYAGN